MTPGQVIRIPSLANNQLSGSRCKNENNTEIIPITLCRWSTSYNRHAGKRPNRGRRASMRTGMAPDQAIRIPSQNNFHKSDLPPPRGRRGHPRHVAARGRPRGRNVPRDPDGRFRLGAKAQDVVRAGSQIGACEDLKRQACGDTEVVRKVYRTLGLEGFPCASLLDPS